MKILRPLFLTALAAFLASAQAQPPPAPEGSDRDAIPRAEEATAVAGSGAGAGSGSGTGAAAQTTPFDPQLLLLQSLEGLEEIAVPELPEQVQSARSDTMPDLQALPQLLLPFAEDASPVQLWQQQQSQLQSLQTRLEVQIWRLWQRVLHAALQDKSLPPALIPWVELRELLRNPLLAQSERENLLRQWSGRYSQHPAALVAKNLEMLLHRPNKNQNKRIAVVLPLSGPLQPAGLLVSAGVQIAWFNLQQSQDNHVELVFFDSNQDAQTLTNQIMSSEVHLVLGPLDKRMVDDFSNTLADNQLHPPVLLLNRTEKPLPNTDFWQFGLPVEQEISALVRFARSNGYQRAGALMSETRSGLRAGDALETAWRDLGGDWIGTEVVAARGDLTEIGRDLLLLEASRRRHALLERITGTKLVHRPRQRSDLDVLFIAAPGGRGHQVTAALAYNYLRGVPLYSLSNIYQPQETSNVFDLESVTFMDMPWMIRPPQELGYDVGLTALEYRKRLVAFGIDALNVALRLERAPPDERLPHWGATGLLTADNRQRLSWSPVPVTVKQGLLIPLAP